MIYIWLVILGGIMIIPILSGAAKELEKKQEKAKDGSQRKKDLKFFIKFLTYLVILIFIVIVIVVARFTGLILSSN